MFPRLGAFLLSMYIALLDESPPPQEEECRRNGSFNSSFGLVESKLLARLLAVRKQVGS